MWRRSFFALTALAVLTGAAGLAARSGAPTGVTALRWQMDHPDFGGWSGIDVTPDGKRFWAVGDRGAVVAGALRREDGQLVAVTSAPPRRLRGEQVPSNSLESADAEGISADPDGSLVVSFERFARVWRHAGWKAAAERIHQHPHFAEMKYNGSLEAVATLPDGTVLTLPEIPTDSHAYPVFRHDGQQWDQPYALARDGSWRAVGADFGPDERLYLLERRFLGIGFASRIRRFDLSAPDGILAGETLYVSPPFRHGNLEGIGIWRDGAGMIRAVLVTDDNFMPFQRSEIAEVILPE